MNGSDGRSVIVDTATICSCVGLRPQLACAQDDNTSCKSHGIHNFIMGYKKRRYQLWLEITLNCKHDAK